MENAGSLLQWAVQHRLHHKYSDQEGDPHSAAQGFWWSHMGWILHESILLRPTETEDDSDSDNNDGIQQPSSKKGRKVDLSKLKDLQLMDLLCDPVVMFDSAVCPWLHMALCFIIFPLIPYFTLTTGGLAECLCMCGVVPYVYRLHSTWLVNSMSHCWSWNEGWRPGVPVNNAFVSLLSLGEGWHQYHHERPWCYTAGQGFTPLSFHHTFPSLYKRWVNPVDTENRILCACGKIGHCADTLLDVVIFNPTRWFIELAYFLHLAKPRTLDKSSATK